MESSNNNSKKDYLVPLSILIAGVLIAGAVIYSTGSGATKVNQEANVGSTVADDPSKVTKDDVVLGNENAPVTVIVYSDPSCPFCAAAAGQNKEVMDYLKQRVSTWSAPVPGIIENYVKSNKVRLVFRYFPGHGTGEPAMKVLLCANEQGKFWEAHDKIFANQNIIEDLEKVKGLVATVGVDTSKINDCFASGKYDEKLVKDTNSGTAAGVQGTPAFFINGEKLEGARSFSEFKTVIEKALGDK